MMKKKLCIAALGFVLVMGLCACGSKGTPITVNIQDGLTTTILETYEGETVEAMLAEAELVAGEKDEITPAPSETVADGGEITISRYASVQVIYDEKDPVTVELCGATVQDAIDKAEVKVGKNDYIDVDTNRLLEDGMVIGITKRAEVTLTVDGKTIKEITAAKTVKEFLKEQGVKLGKHDRISKKPKKKLKDGLKIVINRVKIKKETETENIPYTTTYENSGSMYTDQTSVKRNGQYGEKEIKYKVTLVDGVEESREMVSETVVREPVSEIILKGTKSRAPATPPGQTIVSKQYNDDCDGSGHGTLVITYADGSQKISRY